MILLSFPGSFWERATQMWRIKRCTACCNAGWDSVYSQHSHVVGVCVRIYSIWCDCCETRTEVYSQCYINSDCLFGDLLLQAPFNPNSSICTVQPKTPVGNPKLLKYVDVTEMVKQAQDKPGHWLVTGAKLAVEGGKVCIHVKYSLLLYPMWIVFCTCKTICSTAKRNFHGGQGPTEYMICNVLLWCRGVSQTPL